jgi:HD-GYP domain-containing protein (c-di-GMP phosphodiesterase class II)
MTSVRVYRPRLDPAAAIAELTRSGGTTFDPSVVERFDANLVDFRRNGDGP